MKESLGEYRVGIDFNPSKSDRVGAIKGLAAALIDEINSIDGVGYEVERLKEIATTQIEDGAMWAVKAATKKERQE